MKKTIITATLLTLALGGCAIEEPTPVQPVEGEAKSTSKEKPPIKLVAKRARAKKSILSTGDDLSCVRVTVTNQTKKVISINPLYFAITDTKEVKHDASTALGEYEGQIDTMDLQPKEKAKGLVCVKGNVKPYKVSMTNELFSTAAIAKVSG